MEEIDEATSFEDLPKEARTYVQRLEELVGRAGLGRLDRPRARAEPAGRMRVLVVGGGGREHALAWRLSQSPLVEELLAAPGNAGIASVARCVAVPADDIAGIAALVERETDRPDRRRPRGAARRRSGRRAGRARARRLRSLGGRGPHRGLQGLGEGAHAAPRHPDGARFGAFTALEPAIAFVDELGGPRGREGRRPGRREGRDGCRGSIARRSSALEDALVRGAFGEAGATVLVEEVMEGPEVSAFALVRREHGGPVRAEPGLQADRRR